MKKILYSVNDTHSSVHAKSLPKVTSKKIYTITWTDAYTSEDFWYNDEDHSNSDYLVVTTGYLIEAPDSNPNYYTIASTVSNDGHFCSVINIPKSMVVSKKLISRS